MKVKQSFDNSNLDTGNGHKSTSLYHCQTCKKTFKKFIIFEGHFGFNVKCRSKQNCFLQCYVCGKDFQHSADLRYHLRQHSTNITKPQQTESSAVTEQTKSSAENVQIEGRYNCDICKTSLETNSKLVEHLQEHFKNIIKENNEVCPNTSANVTNNVIDPKKNKKKVKNHICKLCSSAFSSSTKLDEHHVNIHVNGQFKCEICRTQFTFTALIHHERRFHPEVIKEKLVAKELAKKHEIEQKQRLSEAMKVERTHCKVCKIVCYDRKTLDEHMRVHTEGDLECEICKIPFTKLSLVYHERRFHPDLSAEKKSISKGISKKHAAEERVKLAAIKLKNAKFCSICKIVCYDAKKLDDHMKVHTEGDFQCEICKIPFTKNALAYHRKRFHENEDEMIKNRTLLAIERCCATKRNTHEESQTPSEHSAETENIYKRLKEAAKSRSHCLICKYTFHDKKSLGRHMNVHIDGKYKCEICPIWFSKDTLMYHERRFHKQLRKDRLLKARETAISEENDPDENPEFQCDYCEIVSSTSAQKDEHMKVHTEGDLECEICKIPFTKISLSYHERRFHPEKIRKDRLLKAIERNSNISIDITTNGDISKAISKNQCVICKLICKDASSLDKHINYHMGNYQCEVCQILFTKNALMFHLRKVHPDRPELLNKEQVPKFLEISRTNETQSHGTTIRIKCEFCKITCSDKTRFDEHMRVHLEGDVDCEICKIPFTKVALLYHEKRFHPKLRTEKRFKIAFARNSFRTIKQEEGSDESVANDDNDKENQHQCQICKVFCRSWKHFVSHMKVHTVGEFKCEVCQIWYTKVALVDHLKRRHPNRKHELFTKALDNFATFKKNRRPQKSIKNKQTIRCDICKLFFSNQTRLGNHVRVHTGEYECEICKIPFNMRALVKHLSRFHPNQKKELLSKAVESNDEVSGHVDKNGHVITQRNAKCKICEMVCVGKSKLDSHMKVHTEGKMECEICKIPFTKKALIFHRRNFHPDLPKIKKCRMDNNGRVTKQRYQKCHLCKIVCKDKNRLDCHMLVHNGKFQCEICKVPYTMRALQLHLNRVHLDQKKELLAKALENNSSEESHQIRIDKNGHVTTQRLLKCQICKMLCGGKSTLDKHMTVHTEGTLLCEICQITFTKNSLVYHEKHFHPELLQDKITALAEKKSKKIDQFDCNICDLSFTGKKSINQHIRSHTPNGKDSNEFPDTSFNSSEYGEFTSFICTETASTSQVDIIKNDTASQSFQCYICQKYFQKMNHLKAHLNKHIFYQQWIDPVNIHLSNWNPEKSREILLNQPLVLVNKLDINKIDVKSLGQFSEQVLMEIENQPEVNEFFIVNEVSTEDGIDACDRNDTVYRNEQPAAVVNMNVEKNYQAVKLEELPRRPVHTDFIVDSCVIEIDSDSDVEAADVPPAVKRRRTNNHYDQSDKNMNCNGLENAVEINVNSERNLQTTNNHNVNLEKVCSSVNINMNIKTEQLCRRSIHTDVEASCVIDISSDSDSDTELSNIDVFHCYSCDTLCRSLEALSNHKRFCRI